ncbi:MAG: response regulator [Nitrospirae bacterium]|nr:response regulator [Nitrospirota bacterium]
MEENIHILVVDSQQDMRDVLADILQDEGYRVTTVENGYEALERVRAISFNIVIVDIKMPGLSGMKLIRQLREVDSKLTIIIMTGYSSLETAIEAGRAEVYDYITKPFQAEEMLLAIKRAVKEQEIFTENKKLLKELEEAKRNLKESQERLYRSEKSANIGRLAAGVSHELKNLLGIINVVAHCLKKKVDKDDEKATKYLRTIEKEVNHSNQLILNLLSLSRPAEGGFVLTDINELLKETFSLIEHQLSLQNIKVIAEYDPSLPQMPVEANQMKQVFTNIIFNAQEAMPMGGELHIATRFQEVPLGLNGSSVVEIKFEDTGYGIPEKNLKKIFDPFFSTSDREEKSGLGLPISQDIIRRHDGNIEVKSQLNVGTTFIIKLPVKRKIEKKVIQKEEATLDIGMEEKILILMKTTPGGMKPDDIGKILGVDSKLVSGTMEKLVTEGVVFKEGENYRAASVYST